MVRPALTKNIRIKGIIVMIPYYEFLIFNGYDLLNELILLILPKVSIKLVE